MMGSADAFLQVGDAYWQQGKVMDAIQAWENGLTVDPTDKRLRARLISAYCRVGDIQKVLEHLKALPGTEQNFIQVGNFFEKRGQFDKALMVYLQGLALHPFSAQLQALVNACQRRVPAVAPPPFEHREAYGGFFPALFKTWVRACFHPREFFQTVGNSRDLSPALAFGVLVGWVSVLLVSPQYLCPLFALSSMVLPVSILLLPFLLWAILLLGWLPALFLLPIVGLIIHLFLMLFGGANRGVTVTLRVTCYAYAPQIFAAVPFIGWFIAPIWMSVLEIIGLAAAHRTDTWRAALAVFLLILLCVFAHLLERFLPSLGAYPSLP